MSYSDAIRFNLDLLESPRMQSEVQTSLNDCLTAITQLAAQHDCRFSVEELGAFLSQFLFSGEDNEQDALASVYSNMLLKARVQDPDHEMFKTMSLGSLDGTLSPEVQAAIDAVTKNKDPQG